MYVIGKSGNPGGTVLIHPSCYGSSYLKSALNH